MNLRRDIQGMFAYPTLVIFCEGKAGIAAAKALIEATPDSGGLNFPLRQDVRMYYRVSLPLSCIFVLYLTVWGVDPIVKAQSLLAGPACFGVSIPICCLAVTHQTSWLDLSLSPSLSHMCTQLAY